jgi:MFS family permease
LFFNRLDNEKKILLTIESQLLSQFGSAITGFALGIWIFKQQGNVTSLSLLYFFQSLPSIFFSYFSGVLVDSYSRKSILILCEVFFIILLAGLLGCYLLNNLTEKVLYLYVALCTIVSITQTLALGSITGCIVDSKKRVAYNTIINLRKTLPRLIGPLIAGFLILYIDLVPFIIFNLLTYMFSLATIFLLPEIMNNSKGITIPIGIRQYFMYAIRTISQKPLMLYSLVCLQFSVAFTSLLGAYVIPLALAEHTSCTAGMLMACGGVGALLGSSVMTKRFQHTPEIFLPISLIIQSFAMLICSIIMTPVSLAILLFIHFFFVPVQNGCGSTMWQNHVTQAEFGRILSIQGLVLQLTCILVLLVAGPLVDKIVYPLIATKNYMPLPEVFHSFFLAPKESSIYIILCIAGLFGLIIGLILMNRTRFKIKNSNNDMMEQIYG